ncbi:MAG: carboxypeptidase-like regulatory domain-containing protein [Planctomycetota bacterium]
MKNLAPVAMVSVALVAVALALLASTGGEPTPLPSPDALPDTGCLAMGRVLDAAGAPLPGAEVRARIVSPGTAHETPVVYTAEDGSFVLRLFPARGRWSLDVVPPGRPGFTAPDRVEAAPGRELRIEIREPDAPAIEAPPPNITGEVLDSEGRLLTGIPLFVRNAKGEILAEGVSGERGLVSFRVEAALPLFAHAENLEGIPYEVDRLPCPYVKLVVSTTDAVTDTLMVDFRLPGSVENRMARIRLYDNLGQEVLAVNRPVREGPHPLLGMEYGTYDIRVSLPGLAGAIQGFDFRPEERLAVVPLDATATLGGTLSREAKVVLFSRSPARVPVSREFRESDGENSVYRGAWEEMPGIREFDFEGLPAGDYRLRILAAGYETVDEKIRLKAGETRDCGRIDLVPATGKIRVTITDRKDDPESLEFPYVVRIYEVDGHSFAKEVGPGADRSVEFTDLPAGSWMWRVERVMSGREPPRGGLTHATRRIGWDHAIPLAAGETKAVESDCTWRFD